MICYIGVTNDCWMHASDVIALSAFAVSVITVMLSIVNNILTTNPHLITMSHSDVKDDVLYLSATLHNVGFGPAIIRSVEYYYEGVEIKFERPEQLQHFVFEKYKTPLFEPEFMMYYKGAIIPKESEKDIIRFGVACKLPMEEIQHKAQAEKFGLVIRYRSVYWWPKTYDPVKSHGHKKFFTELLEKVTNKE